MSFTITVVLIVLMNSVMNDKSPPRSASVLLWKLNREWFWDILLVKKVNRSDRQGIRERHWPRSVWKRFVSVFDETNLRDLSAILGFPSRHNPLTVTNPPVLWLAVTKLPWTVIGCWKPPLYCDWLLEKSPVLWLAFGNVPCAVISCCKIPLLLL